MVSAKIIQEQLKGLGFNVNGWGKTEINELPNIILPDEKIFECVNGLYEGGFALLVATDVRVLLVDKKPLNYLTVEDLRFDMINEIDYSHRLFGAHIRISAGDTTLKFDSINQPRLRKLIGHVQLCMAESKKKQSYHQEDQNQHLKEINQQLQAYLIAQYEQQQRLHEQLHNVRSNQEAAETLRRLSEPVRPSPELSDYLLAQRLLAQTQAQETIQASKPAALDVPAKQEQSPRDQLAELYADGMREVFSGRRQSSAGRQAVSGQLPAHKFMGVHKSLEINPLQVAYSKLPMALRNRKFGRPSFHAHSRSSASIKA